MKSFGEATLPNLVTFPKNSLKGFYKMKRPMLVSGTAVGFSTAFLVLFGTGALPFLLLGTVSVFVIYFIKPLKLKEKIIIPTVCISVILSCIFFGIYHFTKIAPATKLDKTITDVSGKIITTPQLTPYGIKFVLKADKIGNDDKPAKIQVYLNTEYDIELKLYDYISLPDAKLEIVRNEYNKPDAASISDNIIFETQTQYCSFLWESEKTPYYYCLLFKEIITEQINAYLPQYNAGFLLGMLFGDKTGIDPDITNDFRATGIAHLLAVSGLHTSTWCTYIILFLKLFKIKEKSRNIVCLLFLVLLCIVSAFTPSVMRASIMMAVVLFAPFFKEQQDPLNSLGFSVAILTLQNPYIIVSASFLLSVSATLGVLTALSVHRKIRYKIAKIKNKSIKKTTEYLLNNLITATFTGLFTLPFTTYFFGVFSTVSAVTNILCVKPAFWSLLLGVIATAVSFIPNKITQIIAIFIFKISSLFASFVTEIANALEKFSFCTLPIYKEYFLLSIILMAVILVSAFLIFNPHKKRGMKAIVVALCITVFLSSILLPCTEILPATIYVTNVKNGINVTLRQGLKYAYFNCGASDSNIYFRSLPKAKCEKLDFLYVSKSTNPANDITKHLISYNPQFTVVTEVAKGGLNEAKIDLPDNTIISNSYNHKFNNEITVHIVDTYPASCVIIKSNEKTVLISYGDNSDLKSFFEAYGKPDILILSEALPNALPEDIKTLIISSDSEIILNKNLNTLKSQTQKLYTTAENGDIKIIL